MDQGFSATATMDEISISMDLNIYAACSFGVAATRKVEIR